MDWQTSRFQIDLGAPKIMGIVNITPDSFSDGGQFASPHSAQAHCERLLQDGADLLDLGAESTRPGAAAVPVAIELERLLPVLRHALSLGVPVSVDTYKPAVMQAVLDMGADIINDVWALRWPHDPKGRTGVQIVAAHAQCGVCLMHMHREPQTMQLAPMQGDVLPQVLHFLAQAAQGLRVAGVAAERICLDPGIGFGKTVAQNFALLARQTELLALGYPVLAGWSRKSSLRAVTQTQQTQQNQIDSPAMQERVLPSVVAALLAVQNGAAVVRVHDVKETRQALQVWAATQAAGR